MIKIEELIEEITVAELLLSDIPNYIKNALENKLTKDIAGITDNTLLTDLSDMQIVYLNDVIELWYNQESL